MIDSIINMCTFLHNFHQYLRTFPQDQQRLNQLKRFLECNSNIYDRKNFNGHIVANALVINPKGQVLTLFHNTLQMYLQPGGHVEFKDTSLEKAAQREAEEESGIVDLKLHPWHIDHAIPLLIESHWFPENPKKEEPAHMHHDALYVFITESSNIQLQAEEVSDFSWNSPSEMMSYNPDSFPGQALQRMRYLRLLDRD